MPKRVILSGMRPTGLLHLGNLLGALNNWKNLQDEYECFFMVADWHSLTTDYDNTENIRKYIREMLIDWISVGLDPQKSVLFIQSHIKQHAELTLLLGMIVPLPWLERVPTYKEQIMQLSDKDLSSYGFLGYPLLQTADILAYKANAVPVGEDQLPHLELSREIVRRFNSMYQPVFPEPQSLLSPVPKLLGTDGRKMSKSYGNCIYISDNDETVSKKVMSMITDPARVKRNDPGHPEVCTVFSYHQIFSKADVDRISEQCKKAEIGCVDCKKILFGNLKKLLEPIRKKRQEIEQDPTYIGKVLEEGDKKAKERAEKTLVEVRNAMKI